MYGTAGVIGKAAALLAVPYLTRQLSADGYGLADLATSFAALFTLLVRFGGDIPAARLSALAADRGERRQVLGMYLVATAGVALLTAAVLLPFAGLIASELWASPDNSLIAVLSLLLVPLSALQAALVNVQRYESRPSMFAILAVLDLLAQLLLAVGFVMLGLGPLGVVLGFLLGSAIGLVAAGFSARPYVTVNMEWSVLRRIIIGGLPFLPTMAAFVVADSLARILAANSLGVADVGHLALAIRISSVMALAAGAFSLAWGPYGLALNPEPRTKRIFGRVLWTYFLLLALASVGFGAIAPELVTILAGADFEPTVPAVPALLFATGMSGPLYVLATAAGISERSRAAAWSSLLGAGTQIILSALLLPVLGISGFSIAALVARSLALGALAASVSDVISGSWLRYGGLCIGVITGLIVITGLNVIPEATRAARIAVSLFAGGAGVLILRGIMRS